LTHSPETRGSAAAALPAFLLAAAAIVLRSYVFLRFEQAYFDADQAITGLMAKHLADGRAWPLFYYGQHYMLAVEAWLAAVAFRLAEPSVLTLRLPLFAMNIAAAILLMLAILREPRATAWTALAAVSFFVCAPPIAASRLIEAQGGNIEPFVYVPLLWLTRRRPIIFGIVAAFGVLNRQFTAYALTAIAALALIEPRERFTRGELTRTAGAFAAVWLIVAVLAIPADVLGPGTGADGESMSLGAVGAVTKRVGWHPQYIAGNVKWLLVQNLPALFGAPHDPLSEFIETTTTAPPFWVWWVMLAVGAVIAARVVAIARAGVAVPRVCLYLMLVGAQSAGVYAIAGVDVRAHVLVRYTLLSILFATGLVGAHLLMEPRRGIARGTVALVIAWIALSSIGHVSLIREYATRRPASPYRLLVEYLRGRGVRYGESDYWTAYTVDFLSNEMLVIRSREKVRVTEYQRLVDEHDAEAVQIWRAPGFCARETRVGPWFVCGL
jgi:hypothetical protein